MRFDHLAPPRFEHLRTKPLKVHYFNSIYMNMRSGIQSYPIFLDHTNVSLLDGLDFVFLCLDRGEPKRVIVERLVANGTPFIDVGMGVLLNEQQLGGIVRVTLSTPERRANAAPHISYADREDLQNEYATNIQIADLNAFDAALAVIRWKKHLGFYQDLRGDIYEGFSIASGEIVRAS